jgi:MFS family permease
MTPTACSPPAFPEAEDMGRPIEQGNARAALATIGATAGLAFGPSTMLVFAFGSFVPALQRDFGWSRPEIMLAATIVSLMIVLVAPVQGLLIDRYGARRVVLPSAFAFTIGLLLLSRMPASLAAFYAAYTVLPILAVGLWPVGYLRVVTTWFDQRLGLALGIANSGIGIGAAVLPLVAALVIPEAGWRTAYVGFAGIVALTIPLNFLVLREGSSPSHAAAAAAATGPAMTFTEVRRSASFRVLVLAYFSLGFVATGIVINQVPMLIDRGASPAHAALVQSTCAIAVIAGRLLVGALLDYFSAARVMVLTCLGAATAFLVYASGTIGWPVFLCAGLLGFVLGAEFDVAAYLVRRLFGVGAFGRTYGFLYATFQLATAIGISVLALSQSRTGSYTPGLLAYAASVTIAAFCFWRLGKVTPTRDR